MKREQATERLKELLVNVDAGGRHAQMIDEIWVFGSYARGSLAPGDIDLEVIIAPDEQYRHAEVRAFSGYRHPRVDFLREIRGTRRCFEVAIVRRPELSFPEQKLLFRRGDTLKESLARLVEMPADAAAVRAPRDPVIPQLEGLDKYLARTERAELSALCAAGWIAIERLSVVERQATPDVDRALGWLYSDRSQRRRAASAVAMDLCHRGVDVSRIQVIDAHLGRVLATRSQHLDHLAEPTHAIGWLRAVDDGMRFLGTGGAEYWHVLKIARRPPIDVLRLTPGASVSAARLRNFASNVFGRSEMLPELENWIVRMPRSV